MGTVAVILDAAADTAIGIASLPFRPSMLACSRTSDRIYLASPAESAALVVFDPSGDSVVATVDVGYVVTSLLWDSLPDRLYIGTRSDSGLVRVLDCAGDSLAGDIRVDLSEVWVMALSTAARKLYCADSSSEDEALVRIVNADSLTLIDSIAEVWQPPAMVYSPVTDRLYCPEVEGYGLKVVDCRTDTVRSEPYIELASLAPNTLDGSVYVGPIGSDPVLRLDTNDVVVDTIPVTVSYGDAVGALAFEPARNEVYGSMARDYAFTIDASTDSVTAIFDYTFCKPRQMIHNSAGNKLYLLDPTHDDVLVLDSAGSTLKHIPGGVVSSYSSPLLNSALNRLYVADRSEMRVIDCNSDSLIGTHYLPYSRRPVPVLVPDFGKVYVLDNYSRSGYVSVYDCLRDTAKAILSLPDRVYCGVYDPRSNRVLFACKEAPNIRALDPVSDSVVKTFSLGIVSRLGRMALNPDLGRLYYADQGPNKLFTLDVLRDSLLSVESLPWDIDTMLLDRRLQKLYLCAVDSARVLVYDCARAAIIDTIHADYQYAAFLDERNDKLYLRYGAVVDCRYDSVVAVLPPGSQDPRCMAWDAIDNRVFQANANWLYVYRDDPYGVAEQKLGRLRPVLAVLGNPVRNSLRLRLQVPPGQTGVLTIYDAAGRRVHSSAGLRTAPLDIDARSLAAGIYFVRLKTDAAEASAKVIVQR